jgi:hypothetical protein
MNKNFMIGFMYERYFYCANVHKYHHSSVEYHITILASKLKDGIPSRIVLKEEGRSKQDISTDPVPKSLLDIILREIDKHSLELS